MSYWAIPFNSHTPLIEGFSLKFTPLEIGRSECQHNYPFGPPPRKLPLLTPHPKNSYTFNTGDAYKMDLFFVTLIQSFP